MYVAYAYHTWMESCACQLNFDTKMSGLAYVPKEQGILLTVGKNPGPQPDTASYRQFGRSDTLGMPELALHDVGC